MVAREVERLAVGTPSDVLLAAGPVSHATRRDLAVGALDPHVSERHDGHDLAVWAQRRLACERGHGLLLEEVACVLGRGDRDEPRLRAAGEIERVEPIPYGEGRTLAIGGDGKVLDVLALEGRELLDGAVRRAPEEIDRVVLAVRQEHDRGGRGPERVTVVARPVGEPRERLGRFGGAVEGPDVTRVRAAVVAPRPLAAAALEDHDRAVGEGPCVGSEGIMHAARFAAGERHHVGTRAAVEIALEEGIDVGRLSRRRCADAGQAHRRHVERGHLPQARAIGLHEPQVRPAVTVAGEDDAGTIGKPSAFRIIGRVARQAHRCAALCGHLPEVAAPGEGDLRPIGAQGRQAWEVDRAGCHEGDECTGRCWSDEHEGNVATQAHNA